MKIILLQDIKGFGKKFDIKEVKDGYARNFLAPRKLAVFASPNEIEKLNREKAREGDEREKRVARLKTEAEKLKNSVLEFKLKVGKKGEVFGSIGKKDIEKELSARGLSEAKIELEKPIKSLGEHKILISFEGDIKVPLQIIVRKFL